MLQALLIQPKIILVYNVLINVEFVLIRLI